MGTKSQLKPCQSMMSSPLLKMNGAIFNGIQTNQPGNLKIILERVSFHFISSSLWKSSVLLFTCKQLVCWGTSLWRWFSMLGAISLHLHFVMSYTCIIAMSFVIWFSCKLSNSPLGVYYQLHSWHRSTPCWCIPLYWFSVCQGSWFLLLHGMSAGGVMTQKNTVTKEWSCVSHAQRYAAHLSMTILIA